MRSRSAVFVLLAACVTETVEPTTPPEEWIGPTLGSTHVLRSETTRALPPPKPAPPSADRLLAAANELAVVAPEAEELARAMRRLADALEVVAPASPSEIVAIRRTADALERAPVRKQAKLARTGFEQAARALDRLTVAARANDLEYGATVIALRDAAQTIDPTQPLAEQYASIRGAFRAAVRAVFAANGVPVPHMVGETSTAFR